MTAADQQQIFTWIEQGNNDAVKKAIESKEFPVDCEDKEGMTPLAAASYKGNVELAEFFLSHGADVNTKSHKHGYSPLMFAALAGKPDLCRILMDAGAYAQATNTINKSAGEIAAFVGQHECVTVINNHVSVDDIEKFLHPKGDPSEEKFSKDFVRFVHSLASSHKVHPVAVIFTLRENAEHLALKKKILYVIDRVFEKQLRCKEPNEVMSMKLWLVLITLRQTLEKFSHEKTPAEMCAVYARHLLHMGPSDKVRPNLDRQLRNAILAFPYKQSLLYETMVKAMARTAHGERPSAYEYIVQGLFGQRIFSTIKFCSTCGGPAAKKRCVHCKLPYCSVECQRFDWPIHKRVCGAIAARAEEGEDDVVEIEEGGGGESVGDGEESREAESSAANKEVSAEKEETVEKESGESVERDTSEEKEDGQEKKGE